MTSRTSLGLLRAAQAELTERLLPGLTGDDRYTGAMMKRVLDVLLAEATSIAPPENALQDAGFGNARHLAHSLREGEQPDSAALRAALRDHVERKLRITNPRFLAEAQSAPEETRV